MEPERPIEQSLRKTAQERRAGAGERFVLHPSDRRQLQSEVARVHGASSAGGESWKTVWGRLLPRLAWSFGLAAVLGFALWQFLPGRNQPVGPLAMERLAKKDPETLPEPRHQPAADAFAARQATVPTDKPVAELKLKDGRAPAVPLSAERQETAPVEEAPAPAKAEPALEARDDALAGAPAPNAPPPALALRRAQAPVGSASALPGTPPPPASGSMDSARVTQSTIAQAQPETGAADRLREKEVGAASGGRGAPVWEFRRTAVPGAPTRDAAADRVLRSFTFAQNGSQVRIQDEDKSIYSGYVESGARLGGAVSGNAAASSSPSGTGGPPVLVFRAVGTNVTLSRKVVFDGSLLPVAAGTPARGAYRIEGSATVGDGPPVLVLAEPARP